jgi:hypothetical protein
MFIGLRYRGKDGHCLRHFHIRLFFLTKSPQNSVLKSTHSFSWTFFILTLTIQWLWFHFEKRSSLYFRIPNELLATFCSDVFLLYKPTNLNINILLLTAQYLYVLASIFEMTQNGDLDEQKCPKKLSYEEIPLTTLWTYTICITLYYFDSKLLKMTVSCGICQKNHNYSITYVFAYETPWSKVVTHMAIWR